MFNQPKFPIYTLKLPVTLDFSVGGGKMVLVSLVLQLKIKGGSYMKKFKKLTAGLLGVVMAMSVCSFTALAADGVVAKIGNEEFTSFEDAIAAAKRTENKGCTIEILDEITANGFKTGESGDGNNKFTIDFNGHTYTIDGTVGSTGTQTNGMQLLKGSDITLKNGTIKSDTAKILIQKYGTLKIDDMNLIGGDNCQYVISNNNGTTTITGDTNITARKGWYAFDVYYWPENGYGNVDVIFDDEMTGTVEGKVQYARDDTGKGNWLEEAKLTIESGNFDIEIDDQSDGANASIEIIGGTFKEDVSKYMSSDSAFVKDEDGNYVVADKNEIKDAKFYIANEGDLKKAIDNQADGVTWVFEDKTYELKSTIKITKDITIEGNGAVLNYTKDIANEKDARERCGFHIDSGANVEINDLTIEGKGNIRHGVNVYTGAGQETTEVELNNVTMNDGTGYGLVNNASDVTVTDIETSGNGWGGINVDNAAGTSKSGAKFVMNSGVINESYSVAFENKTGANIDIKIKDGVFKGYVGYGINDDSFGENVDPEKTIDANIISGTFATDVEKFIDEDSHIVKIDGEYVVMDDSKRPTHSYELEEGRVDRNDEEDEKNEPVVTPEEEAGPFSDVGKDNPNYDAIIKVYENGWMAGIGDGVFAPNGTLTRGMGAMVLWNKAGCPEPQNVAPFLDVTSDDWYAKAVAWAYEQGIVAGYGDVFGPDDALTTEQFERMSAIANGKTPEIYVGGAPNATRGWVASLLAM